MSILYLPSNVFSSLSLTFALLICGINAYAGETPANLPGATIIDAKYTKQLLDSGVPVIDVRVAMEYVDEHIKGASNVPYKEKSAKTVNFDVNQDRFDLSKLPPNKTAPVVFYCNAGECWKSYKASTVAIRAGYTRVYWFRGGFPAWKSLGYPTE